MTDGGWPKEASSATLAVWTGVVSRKWSPLCVGRTGPQPNHLLVEKQKQELLRTTTEFDVLTNRVGHLSQFKI